VDRVCAKSRPEISKSLGGWPAKLTATDKHRLVCMIASGKADNAVQLTHALKEVTNVTLSTQTVRCALKEAGMKADLCHDISASILTLPPNTNTGPQSKRIGNVLFGQMRPKLIIWGLMDMSGCGKSLVG